jgi:lysophospholipase L1-like esterase
MPLGDSLTSGNYPGRVHSYRGYLEELLKEAGYAFDFVGTQSRPAHGGTDPDHEGHSGFSIGPDQRRFCDICSTANLYDHLEEYLATEPDIILLLIGINDLLLFEDLPAEPAKAPEKLANLVRRIQELRPETAILVASLAPINYMDSTELAYYAEINQMAEQLGTANPEDRIYFVDLNRSLEAMIDRSAVFTDGVHLGEGGARKMAHAWFEALVGSGLLCISTP